MKNLIVIDKNKLMDSYCKVQTALIAETEARMEHERCNSKTEREKKAFFDLINNAESLDALHGDSHAAENDPVTENIDVEAPREELEALKAWTKTIQIDKPDRIYTNEQIIKSVKGELGSEHRNDTAAKDYFARLANRIEYYGLTDKNFADNHPYWRSYVAYIRQGDFPNPGINRNTYEFASMLNRAIEILQDVKE